MSHKQTLKYFSPVCSSVQQERSDSAEPSSVSVKSHWSIDPPPQMTERRDSLSLALQERSDSPEPSHVSMKSDWSIDPPPQMKEENRSLVQQERSPKSSCVSMKRDWSIDPPPQMNDEDGQKRLSLVQQERSDSAEPSLVSMKSDWSIDPPPQMKDGDRQKSLSLVQQERSDSPEPSHVTMKSNWSIDPPPQMTDRRDSLRQIPRPRPGAEEPISKKMKYDESVIKSQECMENPSLIFSHEVNTFRVNLLKKFQCLYEGMVTQDNPALLNEIYTELYITESESGEISNEHEVRQIETQSRRSTTEDTAIKCRDIFTPLPGQDKAIRTVLTKGVAGIGKTVSVQKFILDWAEEKENQDVQLIFPLPFREINLMKDKTLSLSDLLQLFFPETKEIDIFSDKYKILFIFDGLDECRLLLNFKSNEILQHVTKTSSVDVLLTNLIVGNLLPSALIWITSRPAAADLVPSECVHRVTEVRGFNDPQKEEYFSKRISDQSLANTIISHLKSSRSLYIMCHIPVFCWISATVLEKMLSEAETAEIPKTLTQMYTHFLMAQINIKDRKYHEINKDKEIILKLGKLAYEQLEKGNIIFYEEDLRECGIDVAEASVYSGLCTQIFREEFGLYLGKVFSFVHLSIQEHLAALYVHLSFHNSGENVLEAHEHRETMLSIHKYAFKKAIQSRNGHLDLFFRFLIGLSLETNHRLLEGLLVKKTESILEINKTVEYLRDEFKKQFCPNDCLLLLHCLHELNDHSMNDDIKACEKENMSPDYWRALFCILMTSNERSEEFRLQEYGRSDESLQWLHPVIKLHTKARLNDCNITDVGCTFLTTLLTSLSIVRELDLSHNNLQDSGVEILCVGVNRSAHGTALLKEIEKTRLNKVPAPSCGTHSLHKHENKETFHLHHKTDGLEPLKIKQTERKMHCKVSAPTCGSHSPHLLHLHHRTAGLQDGECSLKSLNLRVCGITEAGSDHLGKVLSLNPSHLKVLDLSWNTIGDPGVKHLCAALEKVDCALETLALAKCGLTEESCAALASALSSKSSSLTDLDMSVNDLQDSGVKKLCVGLQNPHCKLQKLRLANCKVTHEGVTALTEALKSSLSQLKELNLPENNLEESDLNMISMIIDK